MKKSTRFKTIVGVGVVGLVSLCVVLVVGRSPVGMAGMTPGLWQEDLRYLASALPAKHGNAYNQVSKEDFEAAVNELKKSISELDDHEIAAEMGRLVALVGDGHTELWLPQKATGFKRFPFGLYYFGDELVIFAATDPVTDAIGSRVVAIDGVPVSEAYDRVVPLIARDNEFEHLRSAPLYLAIPEILNAVGIAEDPSKAVFTLDGRGGLYDLEVTAATNLSNSTWTNAMDLAAAPTPLYLQHQDSYYWYEYLEDDRTLYLKYNKCRDQPGEASIKRFARELFDFVDRTDVQKFVIDLRHNTGGNFHRNQPLLDGILERPELNQPGHLFVLTSRTTFSAATIAAIDFKRQTAALIVGEPSRGRPNGYSDEKHLRLPNSGIVVNYSPIYREAMPELGDAPYLPVDISVEETFEDYRSGRDPVLETVLRWTAGEAATSLRKTENRTPVGSGKTNDVSGRL
jgi:hypothetical protein